MTQLEPAALAHLLAASAAIVEAEIEALGAEARSGPPGEWCANEVVGHMIEAERRGFAGRIRALLGEDAPTFEGWDQPAVAAARHDCDRDPAELLGEFLALRADSLDLIRSLRPTDLGRGGTHARVGWLTIGDVVAEWVHHDRNHVRQILANTQARVWNQMGNARRFSSPEA